MLNCFLTILDIIGNTIEKTYMIIYQLKNLHSNNEHDIHMSSKNNEESGSYMHDLDFATLIFLISAYYCSYLPNAIKFYS